jgi:hypothetical protein
MSNYIYIGPNLPVWGLQQYKLYLTYDPPSQFLEMQKDNPIFGCLFITTDNLAAARKALRNPSSMESIASKRLVEMVKGIVLSSN